MSAIPVIQVGTGNQTKVITPALLTAIGPDGAPVAIKADSTGQILTSGGGASVSAASTTVAGIVELATTAETTTGTDTSRAVTPAGVAAALAGFSPTVASASDTVAGIVELATLAEAQAGTDTSRAVTPSGLPFSKKSSAWVSVPESTTSTIALTKNVLTYTTNLNSIIIGNSLSTNASDGKVMIGNNVECFQGNSTAIGYVAYATGTQSVGLGYFCRAAGDGTVAIGGNSRQNGDCTGTVTIGSEVGLNNNTYSVAIGKSATMTSGGTNGVSIGRSSTSNTRGVAVGSYSIASGVDSFSVGSYSKSSATSTGEIGVWNFATGGSLRASGVRVHGKTDNTEGYVAFTAAKVASPATMTAGSSGVASEGTEAHGTLMRSGLTFRVNTSNQLLAIYNDAGTIRSLILGTLT